MPELNTTLFKMNYGDSTSGSIMASASGMELAMSSGHFWQSHTQAAIESFSRDMMAPHSGGQFTSNHTGGLYDH